MTPESPEDRLKQEREARASASDADFRGRQALNSRVSSSRPERNDDPMVSQTVLTGAALPSNGKSSRPGQESIPVKFYCYNELGVFGTITLSLVGGFEEEVP